MEDWSSEQGLLFKGHVPKVVNGSQPNTALAGSLMGEGIIECSKIVPVFPHSHKTGGLVGKLRLSYCVATDAKVCVLRAGSGCTAQRAGKSRCAGMPGDMQD